MDLTRGGPQSKDVDTILFDGQGAPLQQVRTRTVSRAPNKYKLSGEFFCLVFSSQVCHWDNLRRTLWLKLYHVLYEKKKEKIFCLFLELWYGNSDEKAQSKFHLTFLHSERPKLYTILAFLSAIGLIKLQREHLWTHL